MCPDIVLVSWLAQFNVAASSFSKGLYKMWVELYGWCFGLWHISSNPPCFYQLLLFPFLCVLFYNHMASQFFLTGNMFCCCLLFSFLLLFFWDVPHFHESSLGSARFSYILQDLQLWNAEAVVSSTRGLHLHLAGSRMKGMFCLEEKKSRCLGGSGKTSHQSSGWGEAPACCQAHPGRGKKKM